MGSESALQIGSTMGGCRCTTRVSRPPQGGVARAGFGQPRCSLKECGQWEVEVRRGGLVG